MPNHTVKLPKAYPAEDCWNILVVSRGHIQDFEIGPRHRNANSETFRAPTNNNYWLWGLMHSCLARMNRFWPVSRIATELRRQTGRRISNRTICWRLLLAGYRAWRPNRCSRLTLEHRRRRRAWGQRYVNWTRQHWSHVIFSDESKCNLFFADGRLSVRRPEGDILIDVCILPGAHKVVPSVMVWGAFHEWGKSDLVFIEGDLN